MPDRQARQPSLHKRLQAMFTALDKHIRGIRLYRGEGRIVEQMAQELQAAVTEVVSDGPVTVRVAPFGVAWEGEPVTDPENRPPYIFRLYLAGVRELGFLPGLEGEELARFVELLATEPPAGEDMVTRLWLADLRHVQHYAVDRFAEREGLADEGAAELVRDRARRSLQSTEAVGAAEVTMSATDVRALHTDDVAAWVQRARCTVEAGEAEQALAAELRAAWAEAMDLARFMAIAATAEGRDAAEPSPMVLGVFDAALARGDAEGVAAMLRRVGDDDVDGTPALAAVRDALLDPSRMARLAPLLGRHPDTLMPAVLALGHILRDPDRDNRLAALEILSSSGDPRVAWLLLSAAEHDDLETRDAEEQRAIMDGLARVRDPRTIDFFDHLLARHTALGGGDLVSLQLQAVDALVGIGTAKALDVLRTATRRWLLSAEVKTAARAALARVQERR